MGTREIVDRMVRDRGWPSRFAREYVMERKVNGLSHGDAMDACYASSWISDEDKNEVRLAECGRIV